MRLANDVARFRSRIKRSSVAPCASDAELHGLPAGIDWPPGTVGVRTRRAQGEPLPRAVCPERRHGGQHGLGAEQLEIAESGPPDLELDPPHLSTGAVAFAPDELPPVIALEGHFGRLVVETGTDALGPSRSEGEAGHGVGVLVGRAAVAPAHEGTAVLGAQLHPFHVHEEVEARDAQDQSFNERSDQVAEMSHRFFGSDRMEELGPGLDPHRGQPAAGREPDPPRLVVEAVAVLAPAVGSEPEREGTQLEGDGHRHPVGEHPLLFEPGQEALGEVAVTGEVEGVNAGGQLSHDGNLVMSQCYMHICDYWSSGL